MARVQTLNADTSMSTNRDSKDIGFKLDSTSENGEFSQLFWLSYNTAAHKSILKLQKSHFLTFYKAVR